jgi:hypothetical protein
MQKDSKTKDMDTGAFNSLIETKVDLIHPESGPDSDGEAERQSVAAVKEMIASQDIM